jgi:aerobic carbon-monoxide dehydrogenase small subunit
VATVLGNVSGRLVLSWGAARGGNPMARISVKVNGTQHSHEVEPRQLLVHYLRDVLGLTGTHVGCDTSQCGSCTVMLDGRTMKSCTMFAVQADGSEVLTIEGLAAGGKLHPVQESFWEEHGLQCGFCTPGLILSAVGLLGDDPHPDEHAIRAGIEGNLCRCTGYHNVVKAVQSAARKLATAPAQAAPTRAQGQ